MSADPAPAPVLAVLGRGVVAADAPVVRADDDGLVRGDGCFEGCRVRVAADGGRAVDKLDAHVARFARSAAALEIDFDEPAWRDLVATAVAAWPGTGEAALKLVLTRGVDGRPTGFARVSAMAAESLRQRRDGLRVVTLARGLAADAFEASPWLLGGVKTLSYAVNMAAHREAVRRGADDVVFVSGDGAVLEAPTASVVWALGRTLHTTPLGPTGILAGTTQQLLFERASAAGWRTSYTLAGVDDLHAADAVWLVSSVRGPVDVVDLDGKSRERQPALDGEIRQLCGFPPGA
ncbi:4-amino-4-deoxychorismate lyase [Jatrophihabitans endophyticus]|uniref:4-amino-4-deoxychorismate lyase n=1 Tax=Jatrophihabitans endophyticus TaxID=1206085 RepID=A0A1M5I9P6_9ACTN|nr:aminotransferase class IV [Jatrophihabitans endophyticus]SHG25118.1 4-amino-4-deoxychorismate lyase [Jatrophihabitans endophyticus]